MRAAPEVWIMNFGDSEGEEEEGEGEGEERPERREARPFAWGTSGAQSVFFFKWHSYLVSESR